MDGETTIEDATSSDISMLEMNFLEKCRLKDKCGQSSSKVKSESESMDIGRDLAEELSNN